MALLQHKAPRRRGRRRAAAARHSCDDDDVGLRPRGHADMRSLCAAATTGDFREATSGCRWRRFGATCEARALCCLTAMAAANKSGARPSSPAAPSTAALVYSDDKRRRLSEQRWRRRWRRLTRARRQLIGASRRPPCLRAYQAAAFSSRPAG